MNKKHNSIIQTIENKNQLRSYILYKNIFNP